MDLALSGLGGFRLVELDTRWREAVGGFRHEGELC